MMELSMLRVFLVVSCIILGFVSASNLSVELLIYKERIKVLSGQLAVKCPSAPLPDPHTNSDNFVEVKSAYDKLARTLVECQRPKVEFTTPKIAEKTTTDILITKPSIAITSAPFPHSAVVTTTSSLPWVNTVSCDFDTDLCGFTQSSSDQFDWTQIARASPSLLTGPKEDHTSGKGKYVYIEATPQQPHDIANLISETVQSDEGFCLSFWYHMRGSDMGSLRVTTQVPGELACSSLLFQQTENLDSKWHQARVNVNEKLPYQLVFSGAVGLSFSGDIALDDISFTKGDCASPVTTTSKPCLNTPSLPIECNFDKDTCGFVQSFHDATDWTVISGPTPTSSTGPLGDHTSGNGQYIYLETSSIREDDAAVLISPIVDGNTTVCLRFWYYMYGTNIDRLTVSLVGVEEKTVIFQRSGSVGRKWLEVGIPISNRRPYRLTFNATRGGGPYGDIALDDISIHREVCPIIPAAAVTLKQLPIECDFDGGLCGFIQSDLDVADWTWHDGETSSSFTGPGGDHTSGKGKYIYLEVSKRKTKDDAVISTPAIGANQEVCLKFWYYMYGSQINSLTVSAVPLNETEPAFTLFQQRKGTEKLNWYEAAVNLSARVSPYQINFRALAGAGYRGDIAIDDVSIIKGSCIVPVVPKSLCLAVTDVTVFCCDFENSTCNFSQSRSDDFDWDFLSGPTSSINTGPNGDHSTGHGSYAYIETTLPRRMNDMASLLSPVIQTGNSSSCLTFWYNMYGENVNTLRVSMHATDGGANSLLFQRIGKHDEYWHKVSVDIVPSSDFQLEFTGVAGNGPKGDIAIDDIMVTECPCPAN